MAQGSVWLEPDELLPPDFSPQTDPLSFPGHCLVPLMLSRPFFRDCSVLAFTQTGFNAMFSHQSTKLYHTQHGICAEVIRLHGNPSETNDLVYTICTKQYIFTPASVLVCCIYLIIIIMVEWVVLDLGVPFCCDTMILAGQVSMSVMPDLLLLKPLW